MRPFPTTNEAHARLARLAGEWAGEERVFPSPWDAAGGTAQGRWQARMGLGGFYLIADYVHEREGAGQFLGHGLYGWDPRGRCHTLHWFDSTGVEHHAPAIGTWEGDVLTLQHELTDYGASRQTYTVHEDGFTFLLENSGDGKAWSPFLEGRYRRA